MSLFLVTFGTMLLAIAGMAVGVLLGRQPIAGSCGGLNNVDAEGNCQSCSRPCESRAQKLLKRRLEGSVNTSHVIKPLDRQTGKL